MRQKILKLLQVVIGNTLEHLCNGYLRTRYFWPFLAGFPFSEVKNLLVTPAGTKIFALITEVFSIVSLI